MQQPKEVFLPRACLIQLRLESNKSKHLQQMATIQISAFFPAYNAGLIARTFHPAEASKEGNTKSSC